MKNLKKVLLTACATSMAMCLAFAFWGCNDNSSDSSSSDSTAGQETLGPQTPFIIERAQVPDAYVGYTYDLMSTIVAEEGVSYTAEAYMKDGENKIPVAVSNMTFMPTEKDVYVYTVITAEKNGKTEKSEEIRIRSLQALDGSTVKKDAVPDAYNGVEYDVAKLIVKKEEVSYSASAYYLTETETKVDIPVSDMKLIPTVENTYIYVVITATDGIYTTVCEPLRICCYPQWACSEILKNFIVEEEYRADVCYQEKFDLNSLIYRQKDVVYTAEAYYLNGTEKEDIPVTDFSLTPTKLYEPLYVVFKVEKGETSYTTEPVLVKTTAREDAKEDFFIYQWKPEGMKKEIVKDNTFVKDGNTWMQISYSGKNCNAFTSIGVIAGDYLPFCTVSDWKNAVLSFWVNNTQDYDLEFNITLKHNQAQTNGVYVTVEANTAKKVAFSLQLMGLAEEMYYNADYYYGSDADLRALVDTITLNVRKPSANAEADSLQFGFDGLNIADYSQEEYPDLEMPLPVAENEIAFVNNKASLVNYRYTVGQNSSTTSLATEDDLAKLTGDYEGKAVKFEAKTDYSRLFIKPRITEEEWDEAVAAGYTKFYYWVAVEDTSAEQNLWMVVRPENSITFTEVRINNEWKKMSFDLTEENKAYMFANDGFKLFVAYRWQGSSFNLYIGDCGFDEETKGMPKAANEIAFVYGEESVSNFKNVSGYASLSLATDEQLKNLTGDYTGKAVMVAGKKNVPMLLGVVPRITEEDWDKAVANGYTNMYIWLTATWDVDAGGVMDMQGKDTENTLQSSNTNLTVSGEWKKFTFELNATNKAKLFTANNVGRVIIFYPYNIETSTFYIGDCGFDEETKVEVSA